MIALIGIILLIGIVKKNAIMMIDFALEAQRQEGKPPREAIYQACLLRFRPIMMTTMAALLGGLPLALGTGVGSELRRPLGIAIVGGLLVSQVLTLYTTPVIFLTFDRMATRFAKWRAKGAVAGNCSGTSVMSISEPFIRKPVATTLLTIALALAGIIAFRLLPVSPLPQVEFPTIQVQAGLARRKSGDDGVVGGDAARAPVRPHRRSDGADLDQLSRRHQHRFAIRSESQYRRRRARRAGRDQRRRADSCRRICRASRPIEKSIPPMRRS